MPVPTVPNLPAPPNRHVDTNEAFNAAIAALLAGLNPWTDAINAALPAVVLEAANYYKATSTTSVAIGTGSKSFTIDTGRMYTAGAPLLIADTAAPTTNYMFATVTSYNSGTGALVVNVATGDAFGSGTKTAWTINLAGIKGATGNPNAGRVDIQEFTSSGTWTKPANGLMTIAVAFGGGGGGASGRRGAAASARGGGGAGGAGGFSFEFFKTSDLGATETVTVGAAGTAGASVAVDSTNGNNGGNGGSTTFGAHLTAPGGTGGLAGTTSGGLGSAGGGTSLVAGAGGASVGTAGSPAIMGGAGGGAASTTASQSSAGAGGCSYWGAGGGGGGASITTGDLVGFGGAGGCQSPTLSTGGGGTAVSGQAGGAGAAFAGGGGGSGQLAGGAGGRAGGGGGGSASTNGTASGAGGAGGAGKCLVITIY